MHLARSTATLRDVSLWQCAVWGLFGGAAVEGLEIVAAIKRSGGRWPWNRRRGPHVTPVIFAIFIRLGISTGLAAAASISQPLTALAAISIGVAAPLIIEKIAQQVPLSDRNDAPEISPPPVRRLRQGENSSPKSTEASETGVHDAS